MIIRKPNEKHIPELKALWKQAFGDSEEYIDAFFEKSFSKERCLLVEQEGKAVSVLYWFDCEYQGKKIAFLYAISTDKDFRGKGICSALIESAHQHLTSLEYSGAILVPANKKLFDFYKRFGYKQTCYISEFSAVASNPIDIRKIDIAEYAMLRKRYLGDGCVLQEGENLDFLEIQSELYAGEDFVLALENENGKIFGTELLGNTERAGEILASLGSAEASFRTIGKEKPFALWLPLKDANLPCPEYFGLAFD